MLRRYVPSQAVVKRPAVVEESNVALRAWLGVRAGVSRATGTIRSGQEPVSGKWAAAVTSGTRERGRSGQARDHWQGGS